MREWFSENAKKSRPPDGANALGGHNPLADESDDEHGADSPMTEASSTQSSKSPAPGDGGIVDFDPDAALMHETAAGSEAAFATLVGRHQNRLLNFFVRMGASSDGEDLVQETFVRLYRYREKYQSSARFSAFLYHLARNVWADHGRKAKRSERLANRLREEASISIPAETAPSDRGVDVEAALQTLSPKLREVIVLNIYQGLRYQEVADALEIPLGTVKSRINLALNALKEVMHER
jgi:RNA polymerase sigma-70 factor, ECF subfamily